jgi:hypothetical protein
MLNDIVEKPLLAICRKGKLFDIDVTDTKISLLMFYNFLDSLRNVGALVSFYLDVESGPLDFLLGTRGKDFGIAPCISYSLSDMEISKS